MHPRPERLLDYREYPVLFVDDEPENLRVFELAFRREFHVATASSGEEALRLFHELPTAVVLSDQRMEGLSGVELLAKIREVDPKTVRILVTAYGDADTLRDAINNGSIYRYVPKPWRPDEMRLTLRNAIELYALDRERSELLRELEILNRVASTLNRELELESLLKCLLSTLTEELGYDGATVLLFDPPRECLHVAACAPAEGEVASRLAQISIHCDQARDFVRDLDQGRIQRWTSEDLLDLGAPVRRLLAEIAAEEVLIVPLIGSTGALAALAVDNRRGGRTFSSSDRTLLGGLAAQAGVTLENGRLVADLRRSRRRAAHADRLATAGALAAGLAQEIMAPIDSARRLLTCPPHEPVDEPVRRERDRVARELGEFGRLVARLGELGGAGTSDGAPEARALEEILEDARLLISHGAKKARVELRIHCDPNLPKRVDPPAQIEHLILNLLALAIRRSPEGSVVSLWVRAGTQGGEPTGLVLELNHAGESGSVKQTDEGLMDPIDRDDLPSEIGLAACHEIVASQGGSIEIENAAAGGEVYRVRFPIEPNPGGSSPLSPPPSR